ncbi:MAG: folate-binding protein [Alphaproteobacteria bacterium]|nr:folate-binding protein [Alphaproteobacteria bacterium]
MTETPYFTRLKNRGALIISGADRTSFLQGLITNDITLLREQDCIYSCLLTPQGKFLFDFFITKQDDSYYLDCEGGERVLALAKMLTMYKIRSDVDIEVKEEIDVFAVIGSNHYGHKDPRHNAMGYRSFEKPDVPEADFENWDKHRIHLIVPDGSRDLIPQNSTLSEGRIDTLNGVSYEKGCYVGQELTARMHYRGLAKKHLHLIHADDLEEKSFPAHGEPIKKDGKTIGEMRSSCGDVGLALLKLT